MNLIQRLNPTGIYVRVALLVFLLVGGLIGLTSLADPFTGYTIDTVHRSQHIHLQVWFFLGGFVLGAGFRIIPQFTGAEAMPRWAPALSAVFFGICAVLWIFVPPVLVHSSLSYSFFIPLISILEGLVWFLFAVTLLPCYFRARKKGVWRWVACAGTLAIGFFAAISMIQWVSLADPFQSAVTPWIRKSAFGFLFVGVPLLAMGICGRVLRKSGDSNLTYLSGVVVLVFSTLSFSGVAGAWIPEYLGSIAILPGFLLLGHGIQVHRQMNRLNIPGFIHGVIVAFSFIFIFSLLHTVVHWTSIAIPFREFVHLWGVGFLTVLIIGFGTWIFPSAAGNVPINSPSIPVSVYMVATGTLLRVTGPILGGMVGWTGSSREVLMFGGGLLQFTGVAVFAVALWRHLPPIYEPA